MPGFDEVMREVERDIEAREKLLRRFVDDPGVNDIWDDPLYRRERVELGSLISGFIAGLAVGCLITFGTLVLQ
jgi:hypothetical protein